jgi:hypothetical protein
MKLSIVALVLFSVIGATACSQRATQSSRNTELRNEEHVAVSVHKDR